MCKLGTQQIVQDFKKKIAKLTRNRTIHKKSSIKKMQVIIMYLPLPQIDKKLEQHGKQNITS